MTATAAVSLRGIHKAFGGVHAVQDVSLDLYPGEVVAVLGHNGAGKSTLMKMLAGVYPIDSGEIRAGRIPNVLSLDFVDTWLTDECLRLTRLNLDAER